MNSPLQERTPVLDLDSSRATAFPADYDTDVESDWSRFSRLFFFPSSIVSFGDTLDLIADGNVFYQKQTASQTAKQVNEMVSRLTSILNIHLNIGQNFTINRSEIFMSLAKQSIDSLINEQFKQLESARIQFPSTFQTNTSPNSTVSVRVRLFLCSLCMTCFHIGF